MATTSTFCFELGFNRLVAPLTAPLRVLPHDLPLYPLQPELVKIGPGSSGTSPAWSSAFRADDKLSLFRLVDITDLQNPDYSAVKPSRIRISFTDPRTGDPANPFTVKVDDWRVLGGMKRRSPAFTPNSRELPTWDVGASAGDPPNDVNSLTFAPTSGAFQRFKLSVAAKIERSPGKEAYYVFDPEMIISGTGQENRRPSREGQPSPSSIRR